MEAKSEGSTASINHNMFCKTCGWPIISARCNYEFVGFKDARNWDWWYYCSNKGCENHDGEGVSQYEHDWVGRINN